MKQKIKDTESMFSCNRYSRFIAFTIREKLLATGIRNKTNHFQYFQVVFIVEKIKLLKKTANAQ